jgi:acetylornithine/succinyldiaminopimelate/putrescine aminotransferase
VATEATGTGLLVALHLDPKVPVVGNDALEQRVRRAGVNVIHGGKNALRFTPWFRINSDEIDLCIDVVRQELKGYLADHPL